MKNQIYLAGLALLTLAVVWPRITPWTSLFASDSEDASQRISELAEHIQDLSGELERVAQMRADEQDGDEPRVDEGENTPAQGRLTTESGVPVSSSDRTGQGTLYYTPYQGSRISVWDGSKWLFHKFTERSLALSATSGKNYDVFVYDNSGTLTLELSAAWTTDVARADALTTRNGVLVKNADNKRRYLGTIRASGANVVADAVATRYVWNYYNRVPRLLKALSTTSAACSASWSYLGSTTKVEFVTGANEAMVLAQAGSMPLGAAYEASGIGLDTTGFSSAALRGVYNAGAPGTYNITEFRDFPGLGYHTLNHIERCSSAWSTVYMNYSTYLVTNLVAYIDG